MKKLILALTMLFFCGFIGLTGYASGLPVKEVVDISLDKYRVAVLTQSGDVYLTTDVLSSSKKFIETDVTRIHSINETANYRLYMLKADGSISVITSRDINIQNYPLSIKTVIDFNTLSYIDNEDNYVIYSNFSRSYGEAVKVVSDVKMVGEALFKKYVIKKDNNLYEYDSNKPKDEQLKFLMSDAYRIYSTRGGVYFLKSNGDLYGIESDMPVKIASNVKLEDGLFPGPRAVGIVNTSNELYIYFNQAPAVFKGNNVKCVTWDLSAGNSYYGVTYDGNKFRGNIFNESMIVVEEQAVKIDYCVEENNTVFYFDQNGVCLNYEFGKEFGSIDFVKYVSTSYNTAYYLFINKQGDAFAVTRHQPKWTKTTLGDKPTRLFFEGKEIELTLNLQTVNNRTMYPFRECITALGASVMWDGVNQIAIGELPGRKIEFPIGRSEYWVNGVRHEMDTAAYVDVSVGRTYIPLRYAAEGLGFTVNWQEGKTENIITITK